MGTAAAELSQWLDLTNGRLALGLLIFARFATLLSAMPLLSHRSVPPPVRIGMAGMLALALTPLMKTAAPGDSGTFIAALVKEVAVGLLLGWTATLFFAAVEMAGEWLDLQGGFQAGQLLNPVMETESAPLGSFTHLLAGIVFLGVGGHALLIRAAAASLVVSPPGVLRLHAGTAGDWTTLLAQVVWMALQMAAPVAASLFLAEIAVGLMSRAMPQVNVMMLTLPAKASLAIGVLALSVPVLARALAVLFSQMGQELSAIVRSLGG